MRKTMWIIISIVVFVGAGLFWQKDVFAPVLFTPRNPEEQLPSSSSVPVEDQEVIAENLDIPWEMVFLPDGSMLITERPGRLVKIGTDKQVIPIDGVEHRGEGGLLGLALHPDFALNNFIYIYITTSSGSNLSNRVERYVLQDTSVTDRKIILGGIPGSSLHDGGRIAFGPDKKLYITTGDAGISSSAQDISSLSGKILRVNDDGSIPSDNPFDTAVYSYGHRNVQGIAWDSAGVLWATEHGRSSPKSGFDEVNRIEKGRNYGWPAVQGDEARSGMELPAIHSGADDTWAPSGVAIFEDTMFFAGLRGQALYSVKIDGNRVQNLTTHIPEKFGRLRTVVLGLDKQLYILTNNTDGRGRPKPGDDKIIRLNPKKLAIDN